MNQAKHRKDIDFLGKSKIAIFISLCLIGLSAYTWIQTGDAKYGVDYRGGTEVVVRANAPTGTGEIRSAIVGAGLAQPIVQAFDTLDVEANEYSIRVGAATDHESLEKQIAAALNDKHPGKFEIIQSSYVGPTIGEELRNKAFLAVMLGLIVILGYVSIRFEFAFALGAVVALFHDVIITLGIYLLSGRQISVSTLAAALTIVGYSVNDTIIIFDRIREELTKQKEGDLLVLINGAINSTLGRTLITSMTTFFSALALLIFGGGAIADLSLFLCVGILTGTYSTVFIASPIVIMWEKMMAARDAKRTAVRSHT